MDAKIKASLTNTHIDILKREKQIRRLHQLIDATFAERDKNERCYESWKNACANFHQNYSRKVFNYDEFEGEAGLLELLHHDNANGDYAREFAVCFIEVRPYFFRSGYLYKHLLRKLNHAPLTSLQRTRYDAVKSAYQQYRLDKLCNIEK
ncbi:MAG: hypothetical protein Q4P13_11675 [Psychrobacter sp.]|nr:hypothetical protein [Psychrobacter sp.]